MPSGPRWDGLNHHARDARDRDATKKAEAASKTAKAKEDAMWKDADDRDGRKRQEKTAAAEAKRQEQLQRKQEKEAQLRAEEEELGRGPKKVLQRDAQREAVRFALTSLGRGGGRGAADDSPTSPLADPLPKGNVNRPQDGGTTSSSSAAAEAGSSPVVVSASGLTCAIQAMGSGAPEDQADRHIGRRARRLYREFYEEQYAKLKEAMPKMRRSQLNDAVWAMWQKCPQNPFVQRAEALAQQALKRDWYDAAPSGDETDDEGEGAPVPSSRGGAAAPPRK